MNLEMEKNVNFNIIFFYNEKSLDLDYKMNFHSPLLAQYSVHLLANDLKIVVFSNWKGFWSPNCW
jgi:hypothetical protein